MDAREPRVVLLLNRSKGLCKAGILDSNSLLTSSTPVDTNVQVCRWVLPDQYSSLLEPSVNDTINNQHIDFAVLENKDNNYQAFLEHKEKTGPTKSVLREPETGSWSTQST
jgi:hypothetical protein